MRNIAGGITLKLKLSVLTYPHRLLSHLYSRTRLDRSPIDCMFTLVIITMVQRLVASARFIYPAVQLHHYHRAVVP